MNRFFRILFLIFLAVIIFGGGLLLGKYVFLKKPAVESVNVEPLKPTPSTATFDFSKLEPAPTAPTRIIDGEISKINGQVISIEADVAKIFPKSPLTVKTINIKVDDKTEYAIVKDSKASETIIGSLSGLSVRNSVSVTISLEETNRDIFTKNDYSAVRILVFPSSKQF